MSTLFSRFDLTQQVWPEFGCITSSGHSVAAHSKNSKNWLDIRQGF